MNGRALMVALGLVALVVGLGYLDSQALVREAPELKSPVLERVGMVSDHFGLDWNVLVNGGNVMNSGHFQLSSTLGQTVIGNSRGAHFKLRSGYWQNFIYRVYLPLALRD